MSRVLRRTDAAFGGSPDIFVSSPCRTDDESCNFSDFFAVQNWGRSRDLRPGRMNRLK
jgi:hypothetical protein